MQAGWGTINWWASAGHMKLPGRLYPACRPGPPQSSLFLKTTVNFARCWLLSLFPVM